MQISEFGVFLSMISVDATLDSWKFTSVSNQTPAPMPTKNAPATSARVRLSFFFPSSPPPFSSGSSGGGGGEPPGGAKFGG
eukprot:scaffold216_cov375-Pavlova_lutheri.AAC.3